MGRLTGTLALCIAMLGIAWSDSARADFALDSFAVSYNDPYTKAPTTQAGAHADITTEFSLGTTTTPTGEVIPDGQLKDIEVDLPAGFYGNPSAIPTCTSSDLITHEGLCNPAAQVGILFVEGPPGQLGIPWPVYNIETTSDEAVVLGAAVFGVLARINISARTGGDFGLQTTIENLNQAVPVFGAKLTLWGLPADEGNDLERICGFACGGVKAGIPVKPFLSLPTRCGDPISTVVRTDTWQNRGRRDSEGDIDLTDPSWVSATQLTPRLTGCDQLVFKPKLSAVPTTGRADSPSGLRIEVENPPNEDPAGLSVAQLRSAEVTLPEGLVMNPAGANGLGACGPAQIGLTSPIAGDRADFNKEPPSCPADAKIGDVELEVSGFSGPMTGGVFLASPYRNPFGDLLSLYLVLEGHGLTFKLAARLLADARTGRLKLAFDDYPQLAFSSLRLNLFKGPLASLRTPPKCGTYTTTAAITPWSSPEAVAASEEYAIDRGPDGRSCAAAEASQPPEPSFEAGSESPIAGTYQPFVLNLSRKDGEPELSGLTLTPPPGLVANLSKTATCSDSALALAASRSGAAEQADPDCPGASRVGAVSAALGAGPAPYRVPGTVYLAGPYGGAPFSLATITPALAGPFDLGTVVVRAAVFVDPLSAQITAVSDPFPTILKGIPLDLRSVSVRLDKPNFTRNPTSCAPMEIGGFSTSVSEQTFPLADHFQVGECAKLSFGPKLTVTALGALTRNGHPAMRAVLRSNPRQSSIARASITMPSTELLDETKIRAVCTRSAYYAGGGGGERCPPASRYGRVRVSTPLFSRPLEGPAYLRSNGGKRRLPDVVASLDGEAHLDLVAHTSSAHGLLRLAFLGLPDVPVKRMVLRIEGGRRGILVNTGDLCRKSPHVSASFLAHNGKSHASRSAVRLRCDSASH